MKNGNKNSNSVVTDILKDRIEVYRKSLLDLTGNNPLINSRITTRGFIRVVDELPDVIMQNFNVQKDMSMDALPDPKLDPKDEKTKIFQQTLNLLKNEDEEYKKEIEELDINDDTVIEAERRIERRLKDKVRKELKMPPHKTVSKEIELAVHAKNNNINPKFELPSPTDISEDGRHQDEAIQTLLLPDELLSRINRMVAKNESEIRETGNRTLKAAFGFLQYVDEKNPSFFKKESSITKNVKSLSIKSRLSPLVLKDINIKAKYSKFYATGVDAENEDNLTLIDLLKKEHNIDLPLYDGNSIEDYFSEIEKIIQKKPNFTLKRQVVFGAIPSSKMVMYNDLDTNNEWLFENENILSMFGSSPSGLASSSYEEYDTDSDETENLVKTFVMDMDSSQHRVITDIAKEKNIAVEGPPGTGKSQTIVNTIASALANNKKVLFIAKKSAALEVVTNRLNALGLEDFILPLLSKNTSRTKLLGKIQKTLKDRTGYLRASRTTIENNAKASRREDLKSTYYPVALNKYKKSRSELSYYSNLISSEFKDTNLKIHTIIGKSIKYENIIKNLPNEIQNIRIDHNNKLFINDDLESIKKDSLYDFIESIEEKADALNKSYKTIKTLKSNWQDFKKPNLNKFSADEILEAAMVLSKTFEKSFQLDSKISVLYNEEKYDYNGDLLTLKNIEEYKNINNRDLVTKICTKNNYHEIENFYKDCENIIKSQNFIKGFLVAPTDEKNLNSIENIKKLLIDNKETKFNISKEVQEIEGLEKKCESLNEYINSIETYIEYFPDTDKETLKKLSFKVLKTIYDIFEKQDSNVLSKRNNIFEDKTNRLELEKFLKLGKEIDKEKNNLKLRVSLEKSPNIAKLNDLLDTIIRQEHKLLPAFLSSSFSKAKQEYNKIFTSSSFDSEEAIQKINELLIVLDKEEKFNNNNNALILLSSTNITSGIDYELNEKIISFYDLVDNNFKNLELIKIKKLIYTCDENLILGMPDLIKSHSDKSNKNESIDNYYDILSVLEPQKKLLRDKKNILKTITPMLKLFINIEEITCDFCDEISNSIKNINKNKEILLSNKTIKLLLGNSYNGLDSKKEEIEEELKVSKIISTNNNSKFILNLFNKNSVSDTRELYENKISIELDIDKQINVFTDLTDISKDFIFSLGDKKLISKFLKTASDDRNGLNAYSNHASALLVFKDTNIMDIINYLLDKNKNLELLGPICKALIWRSLTKDVYKDYGNKLVKYKGEYLNNHRKQLKELDLKIIDLNIKILKEDIINMTNTSKGSRAGKKSEWTEMELINHQISLKNKISISLRQLINRAEKSLKELMPCWIMPPDTVSKILPQKSNLFDLIIIDEASQMQPGEAIGALARGKQAMVVGDTNQLPPPTVFQKKYDGDDDSDDEGTIEESILDLANTVFYPKRRLLWHYRSQHSSLINFSNQKIYDGELQIFPSPTEATSKNLGISLKEVPGLYSEGRNEIEADTIVKQIKSFMHENKNTSLGVVTLNFKQKELIETKVKDETRKDQIMQDYQANWIEKNAGLEVFFIKSLENVQGDERDVMFISTVYGPEKKGARVNRNFTSINQAAGKRRLNVLFTRAKQKIVTFSSMTPDDVGTNNEGSEMLHDWLIYSKTKKIEIAIKTNKEPDSAFEEHVIEQIQSLGFKTEPQVGASGYFIDIGVKHDGYPYGFILGVECDGATYHSSKSARDRDRLRQEILENVGWSIYRIWSTDWFEDALAEKELLKEVLTTKLNELKDNDQLVIDQPKINKDDSYKNWDNTEQNKLLDLFENNEDIEAIAEELDRDKESVTTRLKNLNIISETEENKLSSSEPIDEKSLPEVIEIGDQFTVEDVVNGEKITYTITNTTSMPDKGIINKDTQIARAVLGYSKNDEVGFILSRRLTKVIITKINKKNKN